MGNIDWLINLVSYELNVTFDDVKKRARYMEQIERYVKGEIWDFSKLVDILKEMEKKNVKEKI